MQVKRISYIGIGTLALLLVPLAFTLMNPSAHMNGGGGGGFDWMPGDFVVMGALLFGVGAALDLIWRRAGRYRVIGSAILVFLFLWLWAELAVGVFTNWGS
jgi:hypothetical protein